MSSNPGRPPIPPPLTEPLPVGIISEDELKRKLGNDVSPETLAAYAKGGVKEVTSAKLEDFPPEEQGTYKDILDDAKKVLLRGDATSTSESAEPETNDKKTENETQPESEISKRCPHCNWDQKFPDTVIVSDDDRRMFVRHLLSGDRFIKQYTLASGDITVTLRSRLQEENDLIAIQAKMDVDSGRIPQSQYLTQIMRYMMACSLQRIQIRSDSAPLHVRNFDPIVWIEKDRIVVREVPGELGKNQNVIGFFTQQIFETFSSTLFNFIYGFQQHFDAVLIRLEHEMRAESFFALTSGSG